jgi:hypothetical protein
MLRSFAIIGVDLAEGRRQDPEVRLERFVLVLAGLLVLNGVRVSLVQQPETIIVKS